MFESGISILANSLPTAKGKYPIPFTEVTRAPAKVPFLTFVIVTERADDGGLQVAISFPTMLFVTVFPFTNVRSSETSICSPAKTINGESPVMAIVNSVSSGDGVLHTKSDFPDAAILFGGVYGGLVGVLKAKTGAHEVIVTIMLNYIAALFILWLLKTSLFLRPGRLDPIAPEVNPSAQLPKLFGENLRIHSGIILAILATIFVAWLLKTSTLGFKFRAVGSNASAARTAGISVPFVTTSTMFICGGLAGLGGAIHLIGTEYALGAGIAGSLGFDAITVALLGQATPIGTLFGALLFGALQTGSRTLLSNTGTSPDIVQVIQALIVLFIAAPTLMKTIFRIKKNLNDKSMAAKGWNG